MEENHAYQMVNKRTTPVVKNMEECIWSDTAMSFEIIGHIT